MSKNRSVTYQLFGERTPGWVGKRRMRGVRPIVFPVLLEQEFDGTPPSLPTPGIPPRIRIRISEYVWMALGIPQRSLVTLYTQDAANGEVSLNASVHNVEPLVFSEEAAQDIGFGPGAHGLPFVISLSDVAQISSALKSGEQFGIEVVNVSDDATNSVSSETSAFSPVVSVDDSAFVGIDLDGGQQFEIEVLTISEAASSSRVLGASEYTFGFIEMDLEPTTETIGFDSGNHFLVLPFDPYALPGESADQSATFVSGDHAEILIDLGLVASEAGDMGVAFDQGTYFFALVDEGLEGADVGTVGAAFDSGDHVLILIVVEDVQSDAGQQSAGFDFGEMSEILVLPSGNYPLISEVNNKHVLSLVFDSGDYVQEEAGTGYEEGEILLRFTITAGNDVAILDYYGSNELVTRTFEYNGNTYEIIEKGPGIITLDTPFLGLAVDDKYAVVASPLNLPPPDPVPPEVEDGTALQPEGLLADLGSLSVSFDSGDHTEIRVEAGTVASESGTMGAGFEEGSHSFLLDAGDLASENTDQSVAFDSGTHQEVTVIAEDSADFGDQSVGFESGNHQLVTPPATTTDDATQTADTTAVTADNQKKFGFDETEHTVTFDEDTVGNFSME